MSELSKQLGRGLGDLMSEAGEARTMLSNRDGGFLRVPLTDIQLPGSDSPLPDGPDEQLMSSIGNLGILQPLLVRKAERGYELVSGRQRLVAAAAAGLSSVPVHVLNLSEEECESCRQGDAYRVAPAAPAEQRETASPPQRVEKPRGQWVLNLTLAMLVAFVLGRLSVPGNLQETPPAAAPQQSIEAAAEPEAALQAEAMDASEGAPQTAPGIPLRWSP